MLIENPIRNRCYLGFFVIFFLDTWPLFIMSAAFSANIIDGAIRSGETNVGITEESTTLSLSTPFTLKLDRNGCINASLLHTTIK